MILTEPSFEILESITEAGWAGKDSFGVRLSDVYQINACNHVYSGTITHEGTEYGFVVESGDRNGTMVREWGLSENVGTYEPKPVEPLTFIPKNWATLSPAMKGVYKVWRKEIWFVEMEKSYNYDRHFQPGCVIESHYKSLAAKKGLEVGHLSDIGLKC